jgi:hypothetical protein
MVCDGPSKTGEDNRCNAYKRAVSSSDIDTIRTIGILHFTIVVHDHIADAKFIQKCSTVGTRIPTSIIPLWNVAALLAKTPHLVNPNNPGKTPIIMPSRWRRRINAMRHTLLPSYTSTWSAHKCRMVIFGDHALGALKVVIGGEDCVGHSIMRARAQRRCSVKRLFAFHKPTTLVEWLSLREGRRFRTYQRGSPEGCLFAVTSRSCR